MQNRTPISYGVQFSLENVLFEVESYPSVREGSTCLTYHVRSQELENYIHNKIVFTGPSSRGTILKEFYPILNDTSRIVRDSGTHRLIIPQDIKESLPYHTKYLQFMRNLERQKELFDFESPYDRIVPPIVAEGQVGDSYYYLITNTNGLTYETILKEYDDINLLAKISHFLHILSLFERLHKDGFIMLDIKPDNILLNSNYNTALVIDADSLISYEDVDISKDDLYFTNEKYASPEIKHLKIFFRENDLEAVKELLTPYADMYSLSLIFFELLWDRPYDGEELIGNDFAELLEEFTNKFYAHSENKVPYHCIENAGKQILKMLSRVLVDDLLLRRQSCYPTIHDYKVELETVYEKLLPPEHDYDFLTELDKYKSFLEKMQSYELFEYNLYQLLAKSAKTIEQKDIFLHIGDEKLKRYEYLKSHGPEHGDIRLSKRHYLKYIMWLKFGSATKLIPRLIEKEMKTQNVYAKHVDLFEEGVDFFKNNFEHESLLRGLNVS